MAKQIRPALVLPVCIARALCEHDPRFLAVLKSTVLEFRESQPRESDAHEMLEIFWQALNEPGIFPSQPRRVRPTTGIVERKKPK